MDKSCLSVPCDLQRYEGHRRRGMPLSPAGKGSRGADICGNSDMLKISGKSIGNLNLPDVVTGRRAS